MSPQATTQPTTQPTSEPVSAPTTTLAPPAEGVEGAEVVAAGAAAGAGTRSSYRKNFMQKNGCRYLNYDPTEEDVATFMHQMDITERLIAAKHYNMHIINFPWRLASDERVVARLKGVKFNEQFETGLVIHLWADSNSIALAMDIMMNHWGIPSSSIRHECVVDHSVKAQEEKPQVAVEGVEADAPTSSAPSASSSAKRRRGTKGQVVEVSHEQGQEEEKKEEAAVSAAPSAPENKKRKKAVVVKQEGEGVTEGEGEAAVATPAAKDKSIASASSFNTMPANIPPATSRTLFRPTLEHLLVADMSLQQAKSTMYLKSAQSRLRQPTFAAESEGSYVRDILEPQHPEDVRQAIADSLTVQQLPRVLEWFDSNAMAGSFSVVGASIPGWLYVNPRVTRRKKDTPVIDLVTLLYLALSKKMSEQSLVLCIKQTAKILSARTSEVNRVTYKDKLLARLTNGAMENPTLDKFLENAPRWVELKTLLGINSADDLGLNFYLALNMTLNDLKNDGKFLLKKQKRHRVPAEPVFDENGNLVPPKQAPPSGFRKPVEVTREITDFLGLPEGELVARTDVITFLYKYIKDNDLQIQNDKSFFMPDERLAALLGTDEKVGYFGLAPRIEKYYPTSKKALAAKAAAEAATTSAASAPAISVSA